MAIVNEIPIYPLGRSSLLHVSNHHNVQNCCRDTVSRKMGRIFFFQKTIVSFGGDTSGIKQDWLVRLYLKRKIFVHINKKLSRKVP